MGLISEAVRALIPERKASIGAVVPTWDVGVPQMPPASYDRNAREGYILDELVYACVEVRATSAAEPRVCAYRGKEKLEAHPGLTLLENPNPFMDGFTLWASVMMSLDIGGNAYLLKERSRATKMVELWHLRPDRVQVIPDANRFIRGYLYTIGAQQFTLPASDVIHFKTRHPLNDYYGLAPLTVLAGRVDQDVWQREFVSTFFRNAGMPAGLLTIKRSIDEQERAMITRTFRQKFGGSNVGNLLVIDVDEAKYESMGLPLGASGAALPEMDEINEARIMGVFQVPPSLIPSRLGASSSSYANRASDRELFWEGTLAPIYRYLGSKLSAGMAGEYSDVSRFEFDLSTVRALQEDEDKKHARHREDFKAKLITWTEARLAMGYPEKPDAPGMLMGPANMVESWSEDMLTEPEDDPMLALPAAPGDGGPVPTPAANGQRNGSAH